MGFGSGGGKGGEGGERLLCTALYGSCELKIRLTAPGKAEEEDDDVNDIDGEVQSSAPPASMEGRGEDGDPCSYNANGLPTLVPVKVMHWSLMSVSCEERTAITTATTGHRKAERPGSATYRRPTHMRVYGH